MAGTDEQLLKQTLTKIFQEADVDRKGVVDSKTADAAWKKIAADPAKKDDVEKIHMAVHVSVTIRCRCSVFLSTQVTGCDLILAEYVYYSYFPTC